MCLAKTLLFKTFEKRAPNTGPVIDVDSEDWELSRDMFACGLGDRIYATSAVKTHHAGEAIY
jgi:hypothetical protein